MGDFRDIGTWNVILLSEVCNILYPGGLQGSQLTWMIHDIPALVSLGFGGVFLFV